MGAKARFSSAMTLTAALGLLGWGLESCSDGTFAGKTPQLVGDGSSAAAPSPGPLVFRNEPNSGSLKELPAVDVAGMNLAFDCSSVVEDSLPGDNKTTLGCFLKNKGSSEPVKGGYEVKTVEVKGRDGARISSSNESLAMSDGSMRVNVTLVVSDVEKVQSIAMAPLVDGQLFKAEVWNIDDPANVSSRTRVLHDVYKGDYFSPTYDSKVCNSQVGLFAKNVGSNGSASCPDDSMMVFFSEDYRPKANAREKSPSIACCKLNYEKLLWKADHSARGVVRTVARQCAANEVATGIENYFGTKSLRCTETDGRLGFVVPAATLIIPSAVNSPALGGLLQTVTTALQVVGPLIEAPQKDVNAYSAIQNIMTAFSGRTVTGCRMKSAIVGWVPLQQAAANPVGSLLGGLLGAENDRPFPAGLDPIMVPICGAYTRALGQNYDFESVR